MSPPLDPASLTLLGALGAIAKPVGADRLKARLTAAQAQFDNARDDAFADIAAETALGLVDLSERVEQVAMGARLHSEETEPRAAAVEARLAEVEARISDRAVAAITRNYVLETMREAIKERYGMLVAAAAATILSDVPTEHRARVERTIRELDPTDILELDLLSQVSAPIRERTMFTAGMRRRQEWESSPSRDELLAATVIRLQTDAGEVECTSRGMHVLAILNRWIAGHRSVRLHSQRIDVGYEFEVVRDARALLLLRAREIGNRHHNAEEFDATTQDEAHFEAAKILKKESLIEWTQGRSYRLTARALQAARDRDYLDVMLPASYGVDVAPVPAAKPATRE